MPKPRKSAEDPRYKVKITPTFGSLAQLRVTAPDGTVIARRTIVRPFTVRRYGERAGRDAVEAHKRDRRATLQARVNILRSTLDRPP